MPSLSTSPAPPLQEGTPAGQISLWEAAYLRYETPEEEIRKFMGRLKRLGAREWPVEARIVELFCGRGNGLHALGRLGFRNLEAVDLSPRLIAQFQGAATRYVADCRHLPFAGASKDVVIVQGGLHHLPVLPGDLQQTFAEIRRVLKPEGRVMFVEPWRTPFLNFAHWLWENPVLRRLSSKLDALATMTENERTTYERWLSVPKMITGMAHEHFEPLREFFAWGKWNFLGRPRPK